MERLPLKSKVLNENQIIAESLRERFREHGVLCLNLISGPGSGKTALLERTLASLDPATRVCVLTGDIQTDNDARRLAQYGFPVQQITTGGTCHLDGRMIEKHLAAWNLDRIDLLFIENVGNLVCPSSYDLGENMRLVLLSVTEGEDKPLKYPTIFNSADVAIVSKIDLAAAVEFSWETAYNNIQAVRPGMPVLKLSAKTGEGMEEYSGFLASRLTELRQVACS
jgi:hydrogenase nickel incorporation protein HypB